MKVEFTKNFDKQIDKISDQIILKKIKSAVLKVEAAENIQNIPGIKKLTGYTNHYRLRIGDYRIGITLKNGAVWFAAIAHRKDIYSVFP